MKEIFLPTYAEAMTEALPFTVYMELVCCIPKGHLTTKDAILKYVSEQLNHEYTRVAPSGWFVPTMRDDMYADSGYALRKYKEEHPKEKIKSKYMIPYWRVLSPEGEVDNNESDYIERLKQEGFTIIDIEGDSFTIENYEDYLFDFNNIKIIAPKLGKEVKSQTYTIHGRVGDPVYKVYCPDYGYKFEKIMKFTVEHDDSYDIIEAIKITAEGVKYYTSDNDVEYEISPMALEFLSKSEAMEFINKYCKGFNDKKYKFKTPIYTMLGKEIIERAEIDRYNKIYFVTDKDNKYFLKDENITFSFDTEFFKKYAFAKTTISDGIITSSEFIGEYIGKSEADKAIKKLKSKYSATELESGILSFTEDGANVLIHTIDKCV